MANISHFTQTVNGVSTTYDIHDADAIPRSGGAVMTGPWLGTTFNDNALSIIGGTGWNKGGTIYLNGKDSSILAGAVCVRASDGANAKEFQFFPNGNISHDFVDFDKSTTNSRITVNGGTGWLYGASMSLYGSTEPSYAGNILLNAATSGQNSSIMFMRPDGTWTWSGQAVQLVSDQRLKQQISEIDDKLLDAWEDVEPSQFKYNDAVDTKGKDKARLHTGYVVQQIDSACKSHGVDVSQYGLYCHEEYPQEIEEVEVEQVDGTKTKERKVIREASEHYSLRYTEVYAVECMYLRRCIKQLTARIEQLEKGNNTK